MSEGRYSELEAKLDGDNLTVSYHRARYNPKDTVRINIDDIDSGSTVPLEIRSKSFHYNNKVLLVEKVSKTGDTLVVYTSGGRVMVYRHGDPDTHPLSRLITVRSKVFYVGLSPRSLKLAYVCCVINTYKIPLGESYFMIGDDIKRQKDIPVFYGKVNLARLFIKGLFVDKVSVGELLEGEPQINSRIGIGINIKDSDGRIAKHFLSRGTKRFADRPKWYYAPIARTRRNGYSLSVRRNGHGGLSLVRRLLEGIEKTPRFRFYESRPVSFILYHGAHLARRLSPVIVNIYFEKEASQAEEGAIELFRKARDESIVSKNFFILRDTSEAYEKLKDEQGVVANFTLRSYWLMYRANNHIATETMTAHMNILRSDNKYARMAPYSQKFIFLQHGITYLKAHNKNTSFTKNREAEPDYMIVNSRKERDVTSDMLRIEEERLINSGMPIFDTIEYNHINNESPDIVTLMLTWKPYEEHMHDFTKSTYYKTTVEVYNILKNLVDKKNIRIIAHPKFKNHMAGTDIQDVLWGGSIADALEQSKLLITDYSSVCYNVFYQGGAVIFYQPDLEFYEENNGKLIPNDDEYIGERIFSLADMQALLEGSVVNGKINLARLRTNEHAKIYNSINEHRDGKNVNRIYEFLNKIGIV